MKRTFAARIMAMLLAVAVLVSMTAMAEEVILEDAQTEFSEGVVADSGALDLPDVDIDIDLDDALVDAAADVANEEVVVEQAEEGKEAVAAEVTRLTLGVKEKYYLDVNAIGAGGKVTFVTSDAKIAKVSPKGVIQAVKKGVATITGTTGSGEVTAYEVQVVPAPQEVTLDKTNLVLGVKESKTLTPSIPEDTHASYTWTSKDKTIATVSRMGRITGRKVGTTTVIVKTQNGRTAKARVKVMNAPDAVTLNKTSATVRVYETLSLKATLPENTYSPITWKSSDERVALVSASGRVTALEEGKVTITAETYNGVRATCKLTVESETSAGTVYRALLIGEENFSGQNDCARNRGDVAAMTNMLKNVTGPDGGSYSITRRYSLSANQVLRAISKTFADADEDDVSLFFIATHGDVDESGDFAGALAMSPYGNLMLKDLADALQAVPGKVIVILESCGSGAAVYANGGSVGNDRKTLFEAYKKRTEAFDAAVIEAFARADGAAIQANTGEFRVRNKFYVLTASRYQELSWGWESGDPETSYNYFTLWLTQGVGTSGHMLADVNKNGKTTLNELYNYIVNVGDNYPFRASGQVYYQHVQVYPANSGYVLFCR